MELFYAECEINKDYFRVGDSGLMDGLFVEIQGADCLLSKENALKLADAIQKHYWVNNG
jgi:hypothetical protein